MNPIQHIQLHESEFTKSEIKIMKYVVAHLDVISSYPISTVAEKCKVSKSALLRFCQKCGYKGYSEFKYEISRYLQSVILVDDTHTNAGETMINLYIEQIKNLLKPQIADSFNQLSQLITQANKIKIYGIHETGLSCQYFSYRLATLGIDTETVTYASSIAEKASFSQDNDLNIFLSLSAKTTVIHDAITYSLENKAKTVLLTQNDHHKFRNKIDISILIPTFSYQKKNIFLDAQALLFIAIDLFINNLATHLHTNI